MKTGRLEAFSDGVLAIIITIMVLDMKIPEGTSFEDLKPTIPIFLTYTLSYIHLAMYWNNHHHLLQAATKVNGVILWANLNLLFWLSLFPFVTSWMGKNHLERTPIILYGIVLFMAALAFKILVLCLVKNEGEHSTIAKIYNNDQKSNITLLSYIIGIVISIFHPITSLILYLCMALIWIKPDPRIEKVLKELE